MSVAERKLLKAFRGLPPRDRSRVLRILGAIEQGADAEDVEFDLWVRLLARRNGFDRLRESDVLRELQHLRRPR